MKKLIKKFSKKTIGKCFIIVLILIGIAWLRLVNLEQNSRFIWDESRALVDIHRIFEKRDLTFVGPISEDNLEMFPSLTYYLYLPTTILSGFDPLGPVYTQVVLGVLSCFLVYLVARKKIKNSPFILSILILLLTGFFYPFIVTSRWAWNPNPAIFWGLLFFLLVCLDNLWFLPAAGFFLGLTIYHHYLSLFTIIPALLFLPFAFSKAKIKKTILTLTGFLVSLIPISLFEVKNHYFSGWFNFTATNHKSFFDVSLDNILTRFGATVINFTTFLFSSNQTLSLVLLLLLVIGLISIRKKSSSFYPIFVLAASLFLYTFVNALYPHYYYALIPVIVVSVIPILNHNPKFGLLIILAFIIVSIPKSLNYISQSSYEGDINAVRQVADIVRRDPASKVNLAALISPDPNLKGQRYRDLVLIKGKTLDPVDNYEKSQVLYVVSYSPNPQLVLADKAWEMKSFSNSQVNITGTWQVGKSGYYLYRFQK